MLTHEVNCRIRVIHVVVKEVLDTLLQGGPLFVRELEGRVAAPVNQSIPRDAW